MKLETVIPMTAGIFQQMKNNGYIAPWDDSISPENMDVEYIGNVSGFKPISPLVFKIDRACKPGSVPQSGRCHLSWLSVAGKLLKDKALAAEKAGGKTLCEHGL